MNDSTESTPEVDQTKYLICQHCTRPFNQADLPDMSQERVIVIYCPACFATMDRSIKSR